MYNEIIHTWVLKTEDQLLQEYILQKNEARLLQENKNRICINLQGVSSCFVAGIVCAAKSIKKRRETLSFISSF